MIFLSDLYIAMGAEPWKIPQLSELPEIRPDFAVSADTRNGFEPYLRDPETLARPWAKPGTAGLEHRIGGLEKSDVTGHVSYDAENHQRMVEIRAEKVARIADALPPTEVFGAPRRVTSCSLDGAAPTAQSEPQQKTASLKDFQ